MYKIDENNAKEKYTLLVPATLDAHYPLIKYMFWSKEYRVEILDNKDGITDVGLAFANNDMCYPFILMVGQVVKALQTGRYELDKTRILMPTAGDACRGACYIGKLKSALAKAGLDESKVMTINVRHIEKEISLDINLDMAIRGMLGLYYGDMLMLLSNQVRPYELENGSTDKLWSEWIDRVSQDLKTGKNLTRKSMYRNFEKMCEDFKALPKTDRKKQRIALAGEFYTKYCALGHWDVIKYVEVNDCEMHVNGLSWYALYYIDSHLPVNPGVERSAFLFVRKLLAGMQDKMIECLERHGFYTLPNLDTIKNESKQWVNQNLTVGDGWLMGAEVVGYANHGCNKVLCIAPFGCMANVCAGRGLYPYLQREFPNVHIATVETDASGSQGNYYNRVQMLIHAKG